MSEAIINEKSFVKLYERTKTAITQPMYIASFLPGSVFLEVRREMISDFWIKTCFHSPKLQYAQDIIECTQFVLTDLFIRSWKFSKLSISFRFWILFLTENINNIIFQYVHPTKNVITFNSHPTRLLYPYQTSWIKLPSILKYCIWDIASEISYTVVFHNNIITIVLNPKISCLSYP